MLRLSAQVERLNNRIYEHAGEIEDLKYKAELQLQEQMYIMSYVAQRRKLAYADSEAPAAEEIREYASYLGIDPELDAKWLWIAEEAISCPLPPSWEGMQDDNGAPFFYNKQVRATCFTVDVHLCSNRIESHSCDHVCVAHRRTRASTLTRWTSISARCLPTSNRCVSAVGPLPLSLSLSLSVVHKLIIPCMCTGWNPVRQGQRGGASHRELAAGRGACEEAGSDRQADDNVSRVACVAFNESERFSESIDQTFCPNIICCCCCCICKACICSIVICCPPGC